MNNSYPIISAPKHWLLDTVLYESLKGKNFAEYKLKSGPIRYNPFPFPPVLIMHNFLKLYIQYMIQIFHLQISIFNAVSFSQLKFISFILYSLYICK